MQSCPTIRSAISRPSRASAPLPHARAHPGKLSYGSSGAGTSPHLAMELFKTLNKIDVVHIAYKGAPQALSDLIGGQIPVSISNIPAYLPPILAGRARALAVTSLKRVSQLPNARARHGRLTLRWVPAVPRPTCHPLGE